MDPVPRMPLFAPLAEDQVRDLAIQRERSLPRSIGRPARGAGDRLARYEQQILQAMDLLLPAVVSARQRVYELLDPLVRGGSLTRGRLLNILYPDPSMTQYPARLYEWRNEHFLFLDEHGNPEDQSTAAILVQRELDARKRKLPPARNKPRSFSVWRLDCPRQNPSSYELPLVLLDVGDAGVMKPQPEPASAPYVLATPWKGVTWDDPAWQVSDDVAARWVGDPTNEQLDQWISPEERAALPLSSGGEGRAESLATQVLRLMVAKHLSHDSPSDDSTPT